MSQPLLLGFRGSAGRYRGRRKPRGSKADQALRQVKRLRSKVNAGIDYAIVEGSLVSQAMTGTATPDITFLGPVVGEDMKAKVKSVSVRGTINQNVASAVTDNWRVDLVLDKVPDGANVTPLELYGDATPRISAFKNFLYRSRFKILRSVFGDFNEQGPLSAVINWYVKLNNTQETTSSGSFGVANLLKNALFLVIWTEATANFPIIDLDWRVVSEQE